ncbi:MAG TPA: TAXI family TRAP transporter solute-binding subunit [Burkholderiaceae bacterium]|nr:TAXI family TRAP transporter solute-binding subunit [Burkholderiaceae bacterium]
MAGRLTPFRALISALLAACTASAFAAAEYKIVTASERGTYIQIGRDIGKLVGPAADIELEALPSAGSAENVRRLRYEPGVKFALVQSDVYQAFLDQAAGGNGQARDLIRPLRVILPLYNEEIYFIVRADSPLKAVHEIRDAKISAGPIGSGTALTTTTLYRQMFGQALPEANARFQTNEEALSALVGDRSIDVAVIVAGQPARVLLDMKPEARELIRLLRVDMDHPATKAALKTYFPATVRASSYPNLLAEDLPSIAVKAFLVTYNYVDASTNAYLGAFARSLCRNFERLQSEGHPKWREVRLEMPDVGRGWVYSTPTARELKACTAGAPAASRPAEGAAPARASCSTQERVLGLCR